MHLKKLLLTLMLFSTTLFAADTVHVDWIKHDELEPDSTNRLLARFAYKDSLIAILRYSTSYPETRASGAKFFREVYNLAGDVVNVTAVPELDQVTPTNYCSYDAQKLLGTYINDTVPIIVSFTDSLTVKKVDTLPQFTGSVVTALRQAGDNRALFLKEMTASQTRSLVYTDSTIRELWRRTDVDGFATNSRGEVFLWRSENRGEIEQEDTTAFPLYNHVVSYSKCTPKGVQLWEGEIDDTLADNIEDALTLPSGDWLLSGKSRVSLRPYGGSSFLALHGISNSSGERLWNKEYESPRGVAECLYPLSDATWLISGRSSYGSAPIKDGSYSNPWLLTINAEGDTLHTVQFDGEKHTRISTISRFETGELLVTYNNYKWVRYDENLTPLDTGIFSSSSISVPYRPDTYLYASTYKSGQILSVGTTEQIGHGQFDVFIQIMDTTGKLIATEVYGDANNQYAFDIAQRGENFVLTGEWDSTLWVAEINSSGDTLWSKTYDRYTSGQSVTVIGDDILIGGRYPVDSTGDDSLFCMRINATGNEIWRINLSADGPQSAAAMAILPRDLTFTPGKDKSYLFNKGDILFLDTRDTSSTISILKSSGTKVTSLTFMANYCNIHFTDEEMLLIGSERSKPDELELYGESGGVITAYNYAMKQQWEKKLGTQENNKIKEALPRKDGSIVFMGVYNQHFADKFQGPSSSYVWMGKLSPEHDLLWETHADSTFTIPEQLIALSDKSWITVGYRSPTLYQPPFHSYPGYWYQGASNPIAIKFREGVPVQIAPHSQSLSGDALSILSDRVLFNTAFEGNVQLFSLRGQLLQSTKIDRATRTLPLNQLPAGFYILQLRSGTLTQRLKFSKH